MSAEALFQRRWYPRTNTFCLPVLTRLNFLGSVHPSAM